MNLNTRLMGVAGVLLAGIVLNGCRHPLAIVGEGDILEVGNAVRGCTLEQFRAGDSACTENEVSGDYSVNYKAVPRPGWRFVRWDGPCPPDSDFQHCKFNIEKAGVDWWDKNYPDQSIPPSTAVFQPIKGKIGYLLAGTPVAGVSYNTPTQQGVTGLDGSFQYEEGETVQFSIGATVLGNVTGRARITPFDLAGSPVHSGVQVSLGQPLAPLTLWGEIYPSQEYAWQFGPHDALMGQEFFQRPDRFNAVGNITVMLQSLDDDADPNNAIVIKAGVAKLFRGVRLDLYQREYSLPGSMDGAGAPGDFPTLHYKLAQANSNGLFSVPHGAAKKAVAFQSLYESLGIPDRTYAICPGGWDFDDAAVNCRYDNNGNMTWLKLESGMATSYQYDRYGNRTRQQTGQSIRSWQYNTLGDPVRATLDEDGDGTPETIEIWQYDKFANITRYEQDEDADGTAEQVEVSEYDARGKPLRTQGIGRDPREGATRTWQYHGSGKLKRYEEGFTVVTNGYESTQTQAWQYDTRGRLTLYRQDNEDSQDIGVRWVSIQSRQYDDHGNFWLKEYSGEDKSSSLTLASYYQFDDKGRLARYMEDHNLDGRREQLQTWQYDGNGRVVRYMRDDGYNSKPDYIETWRYTNGKPELAQGSDATGSVIYSRTWRYEKARLIRYERGGDYESHEASDTLQNTSQTWQYDGVGNLTQHTTNEGDRAALIDNWLYDDEGNLTRFERNHDRFGTPGPTESWRFHTTGWGHLFSGPNIWWLYF